MMIIETIEDFIYLEQRFKETETIVIPYFVDARSHPAVNELSLLWVFDIEKQEPNIIVLNHNEGITLPANIINRLQTTKSVYTFNKKQLLHKLPWLEMIDVQSLEYLQTGKPVDIETLAPAAMSHMFNQYWNYANIGKAVPIMVILEFFWEMTRLIQRIISQYGSFQDHPSFTFLNEIAIPTLYSIEKVGLAVNPEVLEGFYKGSQKYINNGMIYSDYNLFTTAGRPSNKFGGLNFAALAKKSGIRESFVSRYENGHLVMIDFESFHLRLIAELMNFELPAEPVHEFLGKQYFQTESLTPEQYEEGKTITFQLMYSDSPSLDVNQLPFFSKLYEYTNYLWMLINTQGFVTSPLFNRKIYLSHIENPSPAKVFNYLIQLSETEYNLKILFELQNYFSVLKTKPILYTYDAILLDVPAEEIRSIRELVVKLEQSGKFPVRVYHGVNYQNLTKVNR